MQKYSKKISYSPKLNGSILDMRKVVAIVR